MQTDFSEKHQDILALPPSESASENIEKPKEKHYKIQYITCLLCAAVSAAVLLTSAIDKISGIISKGVPNYIASELLSLGKDGTNSLGDSISKTAFGNDTNKTATAPKNTIEISFPKIIYVSEEEIINETYDKKEETAQKNENIYSYDISSIPSGTYPIIPIDLSTDTDTDIKNETALQINKNEISKSAKLITPVEITNEPLVLIVHTHGTECYAKEGVPYYNDEINYPRSEDVSHNVVSVGGVMSDELNRLGIPTIHCETMHDKDSYINAYNRSAESIEYYLEKYPSIKYVFDVHRDSMIRSDLTKLKPVALYNGEPCAQIMMIVGSNEKGAPEYDWHSNLVLAAAIQQTMIKDAPNVQRPIYLRGATYNQQHARHGILLEIGSCGNTLDEAHTAARAFASAFAKVLKGN